MRVVLDAGAFIAVDRRDRAVGAMLRLVQQQRIPLVTSGGVVAQVWRGGPRQANLARFLPAVDARAIDATSGRAVGELLARANARDIVDAHVALLARDGDRVVTSDTDDIRVLLDAREVEARIVAI